MASIPLPALDVRVPQQQTDLMGQYGNLLALKNQMAEAPLRQQALQQQVQAGQLGIQQQQQQLKDQQAMTQAMQEWDGKDVNQLVPLVIRHGASADAVMGLKSKVLEQQQAYSKMAADDATTGSKNLETQQKKNDMIAGRLQTVLSLPDDQLGQGITQAAQDLVQQGLLDPQHAQTAAQLSQLPPDQARAKLGIMEKGLMSQTQLMEQAAKQATIDKDKAETHLTQMNVDRGGSTDLDKFETDYLKSNNLADTAENRLAAFKEYTKETKIQPAEVRASTYLQIPTQVFDPTTGQTVYATRQNAIGKQAPSSPDALAARAPVQADAASLKKVQTQFDTINAFETTAGKNIDMALQTAAKIPDLGSRFANTPVRMINDRMLGTPEMAAFRTAMATAQAEAAKVLNSANASGVLSDSARHELEDITSGNLSLKAMQAQWAVIKQDMQNRHDSYQQQISDIKTRLKGGGKAAPSDNQPSDPFAQFGGKKH